MDVRVGQWAADGGGPHGWGTGRGSSGWLGGHDRRQRRSGHRPAGSRPAGEAQRLGSTGAPRSSPASGRPGRRAPASGPTRSGRTRPSRSPRSPGRRVAGAGCDPVDPARSAAGSARRGSDAAPRWDPPQSTAPARRRGPPPGGGRHPRAAHREVPTAGPSRARRSAAAMVDPTRTPLWIRAPSAASPGRSASASMSTPGHVRRCGQDGPCHPRPDRERRPTRDGQRHAALDQQPQQRGQLAIERAVGDQVDQGRVRGRHASRISAGAQPGGAGLEPVSWASRSRAVWTFVISWPYVT